MNTFENIKDPGLDSVWFVDTSWTAKQVDEYLRSKLDMNDRLIVTKLHPGTHQGWLDQSVWNWVNARV
jgi:hypothetical protein